MTLCIAMFGCSQPPSSSPLGVEPKQAGEEADEDGGVSLTLGDEERLKTLLRQRHGKVVFVDFWATWCVPCMQQFPHTVALSQRYGREGLEVISVSMDEPGKREAVLSFLKKRQARFENLITPYGAGSEFLEAFDLRGDVPFYRLYDRKGDLRYVFSGEPDGLEKAEPIEKIDDRIVELLAEQSEP